jgi:GMP synthase PP-ATPase subunit
MSIYRALAGYRMLQLLGFERVSGLRPHVTGFHLVTGMRDGKRDYGLQIEIRCWESTDAKVALPTRLPHETLEQLADWITTKVPGIISVTYNVTKKPPSTIEAV